MAPVASEFQSMSKSSKSQLLLFLHRLVSVNCFQVPESNCVSITLRYLQFPWNDVVRRELYFLGNKTEPHKRYWYHTCPDRLPWV